MKHFVDLTALLEVTENPTLRLHALKTWWNRVADRDRVAGLMLLSGHAPKGIIKQARLREWYGYHTVLPQFLIDAAYQQSGDWCETLAACYQPVGEVKNLSLSQWMLWLEQVRLLPLPVLEGALVQAWDSVPLRQRVIINYWVCGRVWLPDLLPVLCDFLSRAYDLSSQEVAYRLQHSGEYDTEHPEVWFARDAGEGVFDAGVVPFPFVQILPQQYVVVDKIRVCYYYEGVDAVLMIKAQHRGVFLPDGKEITTISPAIRQSMELLPVGIALAGRLVDMTHQAPEYTGVLDNIAQGKKPGVKRCQNLVFFAYDILHYGGYRVKEMMLDERQEVLKELLLHRLDKGGILYEDILDVPALSAMRVLRDGCREMGAVGLLLRHPNGVSGVVWQNEPYVIRCVLLYVKRGKVLRGVDYEEFTMGVLHEGEWVPVARCRPQLAPAAMEGIAATIKTLEQERFGPVRRLAAKMVFRVKFDTALLSRQHKSGLILKNVVVDLWLEDVEPKDTDTLENIRNLCNLHT